MSAVEDRSTVRFAAFGEPAEVAEHDGTERPLPSPGPNEVGLALVASPINPADLMLIRGEYALRPPLPAVAGLEGVARVTEVGEAVLHVQPGDIVPMPPGVGAWQSHVIADAGQVYPLPAGIDALQLSMLAVNPATAYRLLQTTEIQPGEWVVQNAANSAVGRWVIKFAKDAGVNLVNLVRRPELVEELRGLGAEHVAVVEGGLRQDQVAAITDGGPVRLALDAVGGEDTGALLSSLAPGGVLVTYGDMSGERGVFSSADLIFGGRSIRGFNIADWLGTASTQEIGEFYRGPLEALGADWTIPVEATYPLQDVKPALDHASRRGRAGKVLLVGPGL
jgi:NADPH:quinone reductase-like Zn-dependent oxidoreductase